MCGIKTVTWILKELLSRDHEDGCATRQPQSVGSEAYLNGRSQAPTPEDARKDGHIRGRSRRFRSIKVKLDYSSKGYVASS
ncbi:MAG: hypothetical protein LJE89_14445 [Deltaproteobacteria bacterium]|nr:hypothetical protein [Deltaproteobacteria bacterium]